jgi:hypothetical protein
MSDTLKCDNCGHEIFKYHGMWIHSDKEKLHDLILSDKEEKDYLDFNNLTEEDFCRCNNIMNTQFKED